MTRLLLLMLSAALLAGCAATSYYADLSSVTPEKIATDISSQAQSIHYFSTSGYGSFETKSGAYSARFDMSIHRPSSATVSIYGPFGIKVAQVRLTEDTLLVYNSLRNELFMGKPTSDNLRNFLMIASNGSSFTDLLLDLMPPVGHLENPQVYRHDNGNSVSFTYVSRDTVEKYTIDGQFMRTKEYVKTINGTMVTRIAYSDFQNFGKVYLPRSISFDDARHGVSAKLYFQDSSLNQKENVEFSVPPDAKEVILN